MNDKELLHKVVTVYGSEQDEMLIEEAAEVVHAIQKVKRAEKHGTDIELHEAREHLVEELVDLGIMLEQMEIRYPYKALRKRIRTLKLGKLAKKMGETDEA